MLGGSGGICNNLHFDMSDLALLTRRWIYSIIYNWDVVRSEGEYITLSVAKRGGVRSKIPPERLGSIQSPPVWIIARMAALVDSGRLGQTSITTCKPASSWANCATTVPDSVPPVAESAVFS